MDPNRAAGDSMTGPGVRHIALGHGRPPCSGPEHYAEAQRLVNLTYTAEPMAEGEVLPAITIADVTRIANLLAAAQVHAILAHAAAVATSSYSSEHREWEAVMKGEQS